MVKRPNQGVRRYQGVCAWRVGNPLTQLCESELIVDRLSNLALLGPAALLADDHVLLHRHSQTRTLGQLEVALFIEHRWILKDGKAMRVVQFGWIVP